MSDHAEKEHKRALRAELRERRRTLTSTERERATLGLTRSMIECVREFGATSVTCYLSTPEEPNTRPFLDWAREATLRVLLPVSRDDGLLDWAVHDEETVGLYGMPEPSGERLGPLAADTADLMFLPATAVSRSGLRLGGGRGYYDRTVGSMATPPLTFAVVYSHEILDDVPSEPHDQRVDGAVTPLGIERFSGRVS